MKKLFTLCFVIAAVAVSGCASKSSETAVGTQDGLHDSAAGSAQAALLEEARRIVKDVFFAFDSSELDQTAVTHLKNNAAWLVDHETVTVLIEGHCDERGTDEYNMALGERRANVTKSFLQKAGVAPSRMETVSFGEERPFDPGHNEAAWAKNRRAHFVFR